MVAMVASNVEGFLNLKMVLVALVLAVAVAIPSIGGTFADFTASTSNPGNVFQTATLTMTTDHPAADFVQIGDMIPGDSATRTVTVSNTGSVPFTYAVTMANEGGPASAMWTNGVNGLQVELSNAVGVLYDGPVASLSSVETGIEVAAGSTEVLTYVFSMPNSAGNSFQGLSQGVGITYDATQLAGAAR